MTDLGGPAFPRSPHSGDSSDDGMTLRDYFAAAALQGMMAYGVMANEQASDVAPLCFLYADEMIRERSK